MRNAGIHAGALSIAALERNIAACESSPPPKVPEAPKTPRPGFVYLLESGGRYKIGMAVDVEARIKTISQDAACPVVLVHKIPAANKRGTEAYFHAHFAEKRLHGEWFALDPADVEYVKRYPEYIGECR